MIPVALVHRDCPLTRDTLPLPVGQELISTCLYRICRHTVWLLTERVTSPGTASELPMADRENVHDYDLQSVIPGFVREIAGEPLCPSRCASFTRVCVREDGRFELALRSIFDRSEGWKEYNMDTYKISLTIHPPGPRTWTSHFTPSLPAHHHIAFIYT